MLGEDSNDGFNFDMCRTCGQIKKVLLNIYEDDIVSKLRLCTSLKFDSNDGKPNKICELCLANLNISYDFLMTACVTNAVLRADSQTENEPKEENERNEMATSSTTDNFGRPQQDGENGVSNKGIQSPNDENDQDVILNLLDTSEDSSSADEVIDLTGEN